MMTREASSLLEDLAKVPWAALSKVYGNAHASMIGLITRWWIDLDQSAHWILDGAPAYQGNKGKADALFGDESGPVGVLEVEGNDYQAKAVTIRRYFESTRPELKGIWFGLLVLYSYDVTGAGAKRHFVSAEDTATLRLAADITKVCQGTELVVVTIGKLYHHEVGGIRATIDYFSGSADKVQAISFVSGKVKGQATYFERGV